MFTHSENKTPKFTESDFDLKLKQDRLNSIIWIDDIDLVTFEDLTESEFLQNFLEYICPCEFEFNRSSYLTNQYVSILYQLKSFLDCRNFKTAAYLKELKTKFESTIYVDDAKSDLVRLTMLVWFLLKDSEGQVRFTDLSLMQYGLNFTDKSMIKPSFIKGLFLTIHKVLTKLDYFDDEFNLDESSKTDQVNSFVKANQRNIEIKKNNDQTHQFVAESTQFDTLMIDESINFSPGKYDKLLIFVDHLKFKKNIDDDEPICNESIDLSIHEDPHEPDHEYFTRKTSLFNSRKLLEPVGRSKFSQTLSFKYRPNSVSMIPLHYEDSEGQLDDEESEPKPWNHDISKYEGKFN